MEDSLRLEGCNHSTITSTFYVVHVIDCRDLTMAAQENRLLLGSTIRHEEVTLQCYPPNSW